MTTTPPDPDAQTIPLVLDVDGTLLRTDLLLESFWAALGHDVSATLRATARHLRRPAALKQALAGIARPEIDLLPLTPGIEALMTRARAEGRAVHLVSGAEQGLVEALAARLDLPGPHYGSAPGRNLTRATKAALLEQLFGAGGYDYAGNAAADLPAWRGARRVIAVQPGAGLARRIAALGKPVTVVPGGWHPGAALRELRPHHWVKNLLLVLPLLASHSFAPTQLLAVALAAMAFCLGASAIYILNDLLDLKADRTHPEKRHRPIASGALPIGPAMAISAALVLAAIVLSGAVSPAVTGLTLLYMASSLGYSLWLKRRRWLDVLALAAMFLLRVLTGAVAAGVAIPALIAAFAFAAFFALACVKRLTALARMSDRDHLPGRGYSRRDLVPLERAAFAAIPVSAGLLLAYVWGPHAAGLYGSPAVASLAVIPISLFLWRMVRLSLKGKEDYDPVRFLLRDRPGLLLMAAALGLFVLAV